MKHVLLALLLISTCTALAAAEPQCSQEAVDRAKQLLSFHIGDDMQDRMEFESPRSLPSVRNPANPQQSFRVLEVMGHVSPHGEYRMRLIYYMLPRGCLLMGEEVLQLADL